MAHSEISVDDSFKSMPESIDNNFQPFFLLHKSSSRKPDRKPSEPGKTRRRIELSYSPSNNAEDSNIVMTEECDDHVHVNLQMEAFDIVWKKIESTIKDVLRDSNTNVFKEVHYWVYESFKAIKSSGTHGFTEVTRLFPIVTDASCKQLFTGIVLTKNMEFVDDLLTFEGLGLHLKSGGCHVANLSSLDFSSKNGIGGCLRSLLRQFLKTTLDAADISILASWYREHGTGDNPIVVIIDDVERCSGSVLSDFILMLSEWVVKIPIILIMGVATTLDALRNLVTSNALQRLCPFKFMLGSPTERMNSIVESVLVKQCSGFSISHKVAAFMRNYFVRQDGTLTSFIRALKIACIEHFSKEPLSYILGDYSLEEANQAFHDEKCRLFQEKTIKHASKLASYRRCKMAELSVENLAHGLRELARLQNCWSTVVLCLYEAVKFDKIQLLDLLCEALDPKSYSSEASDTHRGLAKDSSVFMSSHIFQKGGFICQAIRKVRDLAEAQLSQLLKRWEKLSAGVIEIHEKVKEFQSVMKCEDGKRSKQDLTNMSKRYASRSHVIMIDSKNEKAAMLIECLVREFMRPIECIPFHEIVCFKDVGKLQLALIGDPRRRIQVDLLEFHKFLQCSCCCRTSNALLPSMNDTSIMYSLAQEHGDLINLHDWYQSFKSIILSPSNKGMRKSKLSPSPKKRKGVNDPEIYSEASIQARFCRAVTELQITGFLRMPSKRRPDFVQRVAFGL